MGPLFLSSIQDYLSEGWQGPSCDQAYRHQPLRGREAKEGGGSLASFPISAMFIFPRLSFQGYLLGSLGLMVLGGLYYIYFSMESHIFKGFLCLSVLLISMVWFYCIVV